MNQDRFTELVTKEFIGDISHEDAKELALLIEADQVYAQKYEMFQKYLYDQEIEQESDREMFRKINAKIATLQGKAEEYTVKKQWPLWWKAAAAVLVIATSLLGIYRLNNPTTLPVRPDHLVKTPRAAKKQITLSDGTRVVLNAGSRIEFPDSFNGETREVSLIGEAFFDVHHDTAHPFIIHTSKMDVKVLGTAFNVKSYPDDSYSETTLIRGKVQVTLKDRPADLITLKPSEKLIVRFDRPVPGQANSTSHEINPLTQITYLQRRDSVVMETSWIDSKIIFKDETFEELAKTLERNYNVDIVFKDPKIKSLKFSGTFGTETIREILDDLKLTEHFTYRIEANKITIN